MAKAPFVIVPELTAIAVAYGNPASSPTRFCPAFR